MKLGYARASARGAGPTLADQTDALTLAGCESIFEDTADRGRDTRPGMDELMATAGHGGTVVVTHLDRLACTAEDTMRAVLELDERGAVVVAQDVDLDTSTPAGRGVLAVLRVLADSGQHPARPQGRPPALDEAQRQRAADALRAGASISKVAHALGVSPSTIKRLKTTLGLTETRATTTGEDPTLATEDARMIELAKDAAAEVAGTRTKLSTVDPVRTAEDEARTVFRLGELFSGPGGIGTGAAAARITDPAYRVEHQWANDYDEDTCKTYALNVMGDIDSDRVIHGDIRTLDYDRLKALGEIDGLAFGFPCNDYSQVGERLGLDGTFGPLYTYGVKALEMFEPAFFVAENVGGLASNKEGAAFKQILADMRAAGYRLVPHLYKFEQYGVPQARHRIIIVGIRDDLDVTFRVPSPAPFADADVSVRSALSGIPKTATHQELTRQSATVVERLELINPGQNAFTADLPERLQIKTKTKISQIYRRLHPDKPSYTVTGSGGGGTHVYHWSEPRALTNRERARLQTFPDTFEFVGSKESVRKQIGMAVPADGAKVIFEAILKSFAGEDYEAVQSSFPRID
ncbi:DNA (cytosine-5-)-methyltransferase [Micrococcus luteus]|nr:DNA (cytosine-5-)-methyltransferase [Micrococcus luteus]